MHFKVYFLTEGNLLTLTHILYSDHDCDFCHIAFFMNIMSLFFPFQLIISVIF